MGFALYAMCFVTMNYWDEAMGNFFNRKNSSTKLETDNF